MRPDHQIALDGVLDLYAEPEDPAAWHGGVTGRPLPGQAGSDREIALVSSGGLLNVGQVILTVGMLRMTFCRRESLSWKHQTQPQTPIYWRRMGACGPDT
jgi:hypothetical protein